MSKPRGRPARFAAPEASQISAVRRAMDAGHMEQARQRLAALRKSFPGFKPLLGLAWELEDRAGEPMRAAAHAYAWHRQAPGSHAALEGLCKSALAAGLVAVHARAQRRLLALDGHSLPGPEPLIDAPLGALTLAQAEAIDLSRMHMDVDDIDAAVAVLQGVDHPSARNNLALALADRGDFAEALSLSEANWQALPANLYALGLLVRLRCRAEGMDGCQGFVAPLRQTQPLRAEDAIAQVAALVFLGHAQAARQAWDAAAGAPFWADASTRQREVFDSLGKPGASLPDGHDLWFASPWFKAMVAISRESGAGEASDRPSPDEDIGRSPKGIRASAAQRWDAQIDACDAHTDYLLRATELGDERVCHMALCVLKRRAQSADVSALAALRRRLTLPGGPDRVRSGLLHWLTAHHLVDPDEPVDAWLEGGLMQVRSRGAQITDEPRANPFPSEGAALHVRVHELIDRKELHEALDLALQLHGMYPAEPTALINLATIKERLGHPLAEFIEDYRRAHALAPDHLFARFGLARCLALQGHLPEARALISNPRDQARWHVSEYLGLLRAQHALALAGGQHESARHITALVDDVQRRFSA